MTEPTATPATPAPTSSAERSKAFNEFQSQNRLRTDTAIKLIVFVSGSLLTLSIGAVLGKQGAIPFEAVPILRLAWGLLFASICAAVAMMVVMLVGAFHMSTIWLKTFDSSSEEFQPIKTWPFVRLLNALFFFSSALTCIAGTGFMGLVANVVAQGIVPLPPPKADATLAVHGLAGEGISIAPWWTTSNVLLGLLIGLLIAEWRERQARQRHKKQHFEALAAEIRMCGAIAKGFLDGGVQSPAYRMPTIAFDSSLPSILTFKQVAPEDRDALIRYYNNVMSFNRCLDYCHDAMIDKRKGIDEGRLAGQVRRAALKARKISEENGSQYKDAICVLAKHVPAESLGPMKFDNPEDGQG